MAHYRLLVRLMSLGLALLIVAACASNAANPSDAASNAAASSVSPSAAVSSVAPAVTSASAAPSPSSVAIDTPAPSEPTIAPTITTGPAPQPQPLAAGWYDNAVCYEIFVRSFYDGDGDGNGDFQGLIQKLDYINDGNPETTTDLGATCVWLMPIMDAASYHGYDVVDYYNVEPDFGTNDDFKQFVSAAHDRGISIVLDLVLNHTSVDHPWFKDAAANPQSPYRDWYIFNPSDPGYRGPWGDVAWHRTPGAGDYFYGVFWSGMPDLDYRNPAVTAEAEKISAFWLNDMGVDGFRLDAIKHLIENGRTQENTPETHAWLRTYESYLEQTKAGTYTVGEIFGATAVSLKDYYPDQLDTYFVFDVGDKLITAAKSGSPLLFLLTAQNANRQLPFQRFSPFLTNHDQNRVMSALGNDMGAMKVAATALLTMPGLPYVYYGEEIGMIGEKPDERIRTPMQWSDAANAGFTSGKAWQPVQLNYFDANVATQNDDPQSLLNLYRRLINLHTRTPALGTGDLEVLRVANQQLAAYLRRTDDQTVLVLINFGREPSENVALVLPEGSTLEPGEYAARPLLDGSEQQLSLLPPGTDPATASDASATQRLEAQTGYVFELTK